MHRPPSTPLIRTGIAVATLACAALFMPPVTRAMAGPLAPELASAEATWVPLLVPPRLQHGAVLDPGRDRMLVFGGDTSAGLSNSVLVLPLSGTSGWSPLDVPGTAPLARRSAGVVYDPVRDRLLVFGGSDGATTYNDLWALSLAGAPHWSFLGSGGALVAPREQHVTVYDAAHDRLVVFGGIDAAHRVRSDCWALPLSGAGTWTSLGATAGAPLARQSASGVYDPVRDRLLVFGGADSNGTLLSDTWALPLGAGGTWGPLPLASGEPVARERAAAAYDASRDQMLVYGGRGSPALQDNVLALSLAGTAAWNVLSSSTASPAGREWAAALVDPARDRLVIHGGGTPGPSSDVLAFALGGTHPWTTLTPTSSPRPLRAASLPRDPVRGRLLMFGGMDAGNVPSNTLWSLDLNGPAVWTQLTPLGTPPAARGYTSAVYDPARDRVLVFGGVSFVPFVVYNDVWALQLSGTPTWQHLSPTGTPPSARYLHSAIVDPVRDRMVVFAGTNGATENNELWTLDLGGTPNWTFWPIGDPVTPAARGTHGAIYDPVRDRMIISGGTDFTNLFQDTWALPLAGAFHWQPLAPNGPTPSPRFLSAWAYDPGRDRLIEYGGTNFAGIRSDDAWALQFGTPDQWLLLEPAGLTPPGRSDHCAAFDPVHDRLLFAGGRTAAGAGLANDLVSLDWAAQLTSVDPPTTLLETALSPPFPNPTHDAVTIRFVARDRGPVRLAIHDVSGRRVRTLEDAAREPGAGVLRWDGRDERGARVAPGVYLVQMRSQGRVLSRRIVLME